MRIKLVLGNSKFQSVPVDYHYRLSSAIYRLFYNTDQDFAKWLHSKGYGEKRRFKLFNFSQIFAETGEYKVDLENRKVIFLTDKVWFYISTPVDEIALALAEALTRRSNITLRVGRNVFSLERATAFATPMFEEGVASLKCVSPVVLTRVVYDKDGKYLPPAYIRPWEQDAEDYLKQNLVNKYMAYTGEDVSRKISVELDRTYIENKKEKCLTSRYVKNEKIVGFRVPVKIFGPPDFLRFIYETGLGVKNSLGFGMVERVGFKM
ncbi:MAG: CRISPR-associated endoribonuclease Cas6 [Thermotogota bacterium]|nr:CRISPR-associated endoribonuclease Cas6 [Thermotogota bacterium]